MITRIQKALAARRSELTEEKGFTLIELLVVVIIIGILAAIAIPQFAAYRAKGFDGRAESDCRNAATAMEAYFVDKSTYVGATPANLPGFVNSKDVTVTITPGIGDGPLRSGCPAPCAGSLMSSVRI